MNVNYYNYINYDEMVAERLKYAVYTSAVKTLTGILIVCFVNSQPCLNDKTIRPCSKAMQDMFTKLKLSYTVKSLELTKQKFRTISNLQ